MTRPTPSSARTAEPRRTPIWVLVLILTAALVAAVFYRQNPVAEQAKGYAGTVAVASAGTYVSLRTLNAVLSSV